MKVKLPMKLTKKQQEVLNAEINKQIVENEAQYDMDYEAAIAWVLHKHYGFSCLQLLVFRKLFQEETKRLRAGYVDGHVYPQRAALKELGYDVEALAKQDKGET